MPSESFTTAQQDLRTFGTQQSRLLDDLNRPDLQAQVTSYLQDAMRYFQRKAWFFNEIDNSVVPQYANATNYPLGSCVQVNVGGTIYVFCALNTGLSMAVGAPVWTPIPFIVPANNPPVFPPPPSGTAGTVNDNGGPPTGIIWANIGQFQPQASGIFTQLSTVYNINQYTPPIDYVSPSLVEVVWSGNLRQPMSKISYQELRGYDVIRPSPPYSYPTMWAYFQQQIYLWPYPNSFYAITLSYRTAPLLVSQANDSNFWTTIAERLIRKYAQAAIEREVLKDDAAAGLSMQAVKEELNALRSQGIATNNPVNSGIPAADW